MRNRWTKVVFLIALPVILFLIIAEQKSWRPRTLAVGIPNFSLAFSSDSNTLIVGRHVSPWGSTSQNFQLWDASSGALLQVLPEANSGAILAALAPDKKTVAGALGKGTIKLWNVQTGQPICTLHRSISKVLATTAIAFSPDGKILAEGRGDGGNYAPPYPGTVLLWDTETETLKHALNTGGNTVYSFFFSPDGKMLIGSGLYAVQIWDVSTGSLLCKLKDKALLAPRLAFSSDGKTLASVDSRKPVMLWDVRTGTLKRKLSGHKDRIYSNIAFAPDGKVLAGVSNQTGLPPPRSGATAFAYNGPGVSVNGEVCLWNVRTGALLRALKNGTSPMSLAIFSPDGDMVAVSSDRKVILWEVKTGELVRKLSGHRKPVSALAFAPDGRTLATGSEDKTAKLWRIR